MEELQEQVRQLVYRAASSHQTTRQQALGQVILKAAPHVCVCTFLHVHMAGAGILLISSHLQMYYDGAAAMDFHELLGVDEVVLAAACTKLVDTLILAGELDPGVQPSWTRLSCVSAAFVTPLTKQRMQSPLLL